MKTELGWWRRNGAYLMGWVIFWLMVAAGLVALILALRAHGFEKIDRRDAWESHCEEISGLVVPQYRAPDWCVVGEEIVEVYGE